MAKQASLKTEITAEDKTKTALKNATNSVNNLCTNTENASKKMQDSFKNIKNSIEQTETATSKTNSIMAAFQGGFVAQMATSMAGSIKESVLAFSAQNDALVKQSRAVGISMESMQGLQYACDRQGISFDSLQGNLKKFTGTMSGLKSGQGSLASQMKATNPALYEQMRSAKSNKEAFLMAADAIKNLGSASERAALSQKIFGQSGVELNKLFEAGGDGIQELMDEQSQYGNVSTDTANMCEEFNDVLSKLQYAFQGIKNALLSALMPGLLAIMKPFESIGGSGRKIATIFGKLISVFMKIAPTIITAVIAFKMMQIALVLGPKIMKAYRIGMMMMRNPMIALKAFNGLFNGIVGGPWIVAIATAIALFILLYKKCEGFRNMIQKIAELIKGAFMPAFLWIKNVFESIWKGIQKLLPFLKKKEKLEEELEPPIEPEAEEVAAMQEGKLAGMHAENKSLSIDVNFNNLPAGVSVMQSRPVEGVKLNLGYSGS